MLSFIWSDRNNSIFLLNYTNEIKHYGSSIKRDLCRMCTEIKAIKSRLKAGYSISIFWHTHTLMIFWWYRLDKLTLPSFLPHSSPLFPVLSLCLFALVGFRGPAWVSEGWVLKIPWQQADNTGTSKQRKWKIDWIKQFLFVWIEMGMCDVCLNHYLLQTWAKYIGHPVSSVFGKLWS